MILAVLCTRLFGFARVDRALAELPPGARGRAADLTDPAPVCRLFGAASWQALYWWGGA